MGQQNDDDPPIEGSASTDGKGLTALAGTVGEIAGKKNLKERFKVAIPAVPEADPDQQQKCISAALKIRDKRQAEVAAAKSKKITDTSDIVRYVECEYCLGPGIWVFGDPADTLTENDWSASYKPKGMYWSPREVPHCQCCAGEGKKYHLKMLTQTVGAPGQEIPTGILCNMRFVREIKRADYEQLVGGK